MTPFKTLLRGRGSPVPEPGLRFRQAGETAFGAPHRDVWRLEAVHTAADGIRHARLRHAADVTRTSHVAVSVLLDRAHFVPVGPA